MRNPSVSISKGIAIILMVVGHAGCAAWLYDYIYMFHMPLFFFMSGYCFRESYLSETKGFVIKKIKGVWWPFVKWELIFLLLHNVFYSLNIYNGEYGFQDKVSHLYDLSETLKYALKTIIMQHGEQLLGGFWFLRSLFIGIMLFYFSTFIINKLIKKRLAADLMVGIELLLGALLLGWLAKISTKDVVASLFIWIGYVYHKYNMHIENKWYFIIISALFVALSSIFWCCGMFDLTFRLIIPYVITGTIGTLMILGISEHFSEWNSVLKRMLVFIGDNTLDILIWHLLSFKIISLLIIFLYELPIGRLAEYPVIEEFAHQGWCLVYCIIGVCMPLGISILKAKIYHKNEQ